LVERGSDLELDTAVTELAAFRRQEHTLAVRFSGGSVRSANLTSPACCQVVELPSDHLLPIFIFSSAVRVLTP
jgi:hypothetical protein